ncbi:MAG: aminotransferase class I/II-fold pyridoxal phosphate-dependent enzyme, partial [Actinobacteria bacterium]|nr:aminotransferase class I/II-fold pyridoxal phosphate-dependent enzyme [Actinomycetota bacterium]
AGQFILGPNVAAFEDEFASAVGARHAVGVANGTDALTIALRALGVGPGDEVVVPSFSYYASAEAIPPTGATPVFCDVDPQTYLATADNVKAVMTPRTKAVIAVHLFGNLAPVAEIEALGVPVVEDAAQAAGSTGSDGRPGALGTIAAHSFYPSKNLGAFGDGGAVTTSDDELADRVRMLRFHGSRDRVTYDEVGYNSRLDEIQAAVLRIALTALPRWAAHRAAAGDRYEELGLGELVTLPQAVDGSVPAWHLYVVATDRPDDLAAKLVAAGIEARGYYRVPIHLQPSMSNWRPADGSLPGTDEAAARHLAIPISATITDQQLAAVVDAVGAALS